MNDYMRRILNQENQKLNNPALQRWAKAHPRPIVVTHDLAQIFRALEERGIDISQGLEGLRLYPEYKDDILEVYFGFFDSVDEQTRKELANEIVNQQPEKRHLPMIEGLFASIEGDSSFAMSMRWALIQPISRKIARSYDNLRHYLCDFSPGDYRVHISRLLHKVRDEPEKAYALAVDLLEADDFATIAGTLESLRKIGLKEQDRARVEKLLNHSAPVVRKEAKRLLAI